MSGTSHSALSLTHTLSHSLSRSLTLSLPLTLILSLSLSLPHNRSLSLTLSVYRVFCNVGPGQTADAGKDEQPLRALVRKLNEGLTMHETFPVCPPPH